MNTTPPADSCARRHHTPPPRRRLPYWLPSACLAAFIGIALAAVFFLGLSSGAPRP
jgi:hypothetical protein